MSADDNNFDPNFLFQSVQDALSFDDVSEALDAEVQKFPAVDPALEQLLDFDRQVLHQMLEEYSAPEDDGDLSDVAALRSMARNHRPSRQTHTTPRSTIHSEDTISWLNALPYGEVILTRQGAVVFIYASGTFEQMSAWRESTGLAFFTSVVPETTFLGLSDDFRTFVKSNAAVHTFEHTYVSSAGSQHLKAMFEYRPKNAHVHMTLTRQRQN